MFGQTKKRTTNVCCWVAQLAERTAVNRLVGGSTPLPAATFIMKIIVFENIENQVFLNVEEILHIHNHKFARYTETKITLKNKHFIYIVDHNHTDFVHTYLYDFMNDANRSFEVLPAEDVESCNHTSSLVLKDWISRVMRK